MVCNGLINICNCKMSIISSKGRLPKLLYKERKKNKQNHSIVNNYIVCKLTERSLKFCRLSAFFVLIITTLWKLYDN